MLTQPGLYYPYIHFRDENWVKLSALYWPSMCRIVPANYPTRDSRVVRELSEELGWVRNIAPGESTIRAAVPFLELVALHGRQLVDTLAVTPKKFDSLSRHQNEQQGAFILESKLTQQLIRRLDNLGLLVIQPKNDQLLGPDDASRQHGHYYRWVGMHERLAAIYMCVLAEDIARTHALSPTTSEPAAQAAIGGWTVEQVAERLLGLPVAKDSARPHTEAVAHMAIQMAMPRSPEAISARRIIEFRRAHHDELEAFQTAVSQAAAELERLPSGINPDILNDHLRTVTTKYLDQPRRELSAALKSARIETLQSCLGIQVTLPGLAAVGAAGIGVAPALGLALGVAVGVLEVVTGDRRRRNGARKASPAANYLLQLSQVPNPNMAVREAMQLLAP